MVTGVSGYVDSEYEIVIDKLGIFVPTESQRLECGHEVSATRVARASKARQLIYNTRTIWRINQLSIKTIENTETRTSSIN